CCTTATVSRCWSSHLPRRATIVARQAAQLTVSRERPSRCSPASAACRRRPARGSFAPPLGLGRRREVFLKSLQIAHHGPIHLLDIAAHIPQHLGHVFAQVFSTRADAATYRAHLLLGALERIFDAADHTSVVFEACVRTRRGSLSRGRFRSPSRGGFRRRFAARRALASGFRRSGFLFSGHQRSYPRCETVVARFAQLRSG